MVHLNVERFCSPFKYIFIKLCITFNNAHNLHVFFSKHCCVKIYIGIIFLILRQLTDLVKEKHDAFSRLKTLEDLMDALRAENESLRQSLAVTSGHLVIRTDSRDVAEG